MNFQILVGNNPELSRKIQLLAFSKGIVWGYMDKEKQKNVDYTQQPILTFRGKEMFFIRGHMPACDLPIFEPKEGIKKLESLPDPNTIPKVGQFWCHVNNINYPVYMRIEDKAHAAVGLKDSIAFFYSVDSTGKIVYTAKNAERRYCPVIILPDRKSF